MFIFSPIVYFLITFVLLIQSKPCLVLSENIILKLKVTSAQRSEELRVQTVIDGPEARYKDEVQMFNAPDRFS